MMQNLLLRLEDTPELILVDSDEGCVTYKHAADKIKYITDILIAADSKTVAMLADNQADWIFFDLACQINNICFIPLPLFFSPNQLQHSIVTAGVDIIITDQPERISTLENTAYNEVTLINNLHIYKISNPAKANMPKETEKITFTSGSTGSPKGVCLTSEQQWLVARSLAKAANIKQSRHLCVLPLSTLLENIAGVYTPLLANGTIILSPMKELGFNGSADFQLAKLLQSIERTLPNSLVLLPQLLLALVNAAESGWKVPDSLKFVAVGGGKVSKQLIQRAHQCQIPVFEGYGLSECASVVSLNTAEASNPGTIGKPLPHVNVEINNHEIVVKSGIFLGYINEPASWYKTEVATGDMGHFDSDGYLHIDGRKKNILVSSYGRNINPEWVESELLCYSLISQCVVFGDAKPYCTALISPRRNDIDDSVIQQLIDKTNQHLPDYARVKAWLKLEKPLNPDDGLLTANGRPCRFHITEYYRTEIEQMYTQNIQSNHEKSSQAHITQEQYA